MHTVRVVELSPGRSADSQIIVRLMLMPDLTFALRLLCNVLQSS
jgi:hypothetical protein